MRHCESCGSELPDWARFCGSCGHPLPALAARAATELFRKAKDMIAWIILAYKRVVRRNNLSSSLRNSIMLGSSLAILFPQVKHRGIRYFLWLHALVHPFIHAIGNVAIMVGSSLAISFQQVKHRG